MRNPRDQDTTEAPTDPDINTSHPVPRRPYPPKFHLDVSGLSDTGRVRSNNEDHFLVARVGRSLQTMLSNIPDGEVPSRFDEVGWVMMVADGMGGAVGGDVASRMAISTLMNMVLDVPNWIMRLDDASAQEMMKRAVRYYREVDSALADYAKTHPQLSGMGTTMTVGYIMGKDLLLAHVGDSRAYLFRNGELQRLTRDHTRVQDLVDAGLIQREEVATHRLRNVLTNALGGSKRAVEVEIHRVTLEDDDRLVLCTDGLTDMVDDAGISELLSHTRDSRIACKSLVDLALENGGRDNITVLVAKYTQTR